MCVRLGTGQQGREICSDPRVQAPRMSPRQNWKTRTVCDSFSSDISNQKRSQHESPLFLVDFTREAQFMVSTCSFQESARVVIYACLAKLETQDGLPLFRGVDEERSTFVVDVCKLGALVLKEQAHDSNVNFQFLFIW